jgi:ferredoxin
MLFIDPVECIDCGARVPVCPVSAIFALDDLLRPVNLHYFTVTVTSARVDNEPSLAIARST